MFALGNPYETHTWRNGMQFRTSRHGPCTITLSSAAEGDRGKKVRVSVADVYGYASEVLRSCEGSGTGGTNGFEGGWRVEVSRVAGG